LSPDGLGNWRAILRRPIWLLLILVLFGGGAFAAVHGWAAYQFRAGQSALDRYQHEQALGHLEQCLAIWPRSVPAHILAARALRRLNRFDEGLEHVDRARAAADPAAAPEVAFEWAMLRCVMGDLRTTEEPLRAHAQRYPADAPLVWEALSLGYRRRRRLPEALGALNLWLRVDPENVYALFLRGELHRQVGVVGQARADYERVIDIDPAHHGARRHLARCLLLVGRYREAAGHLDVVMQTAPDDRELLTMRAECHRHLRERDPAAGMLDKVLREHPDYAPALRERGRLALTASDFAEAHDWLQKAVRASPHDYESRFALHQALQGLGRADDAKQELARAQQIKDRRERISEIQTQQMTKSPYDAALHCELGELLIALGQTDDGVNWLQSAVLLNPELAAAHAALARQYEAQGDSQRAEHHRREAERTQRPRTPK
jgi:tetratricopeptide (TPR) repeat protein